MRGAVNERVGDNSGTQTGELMVPYKGVDVYRILENGSVEAVDLPFVDCYINIRDIYVLEDTDILLEIREQYGDIIGVMRNANYAPKVDDESARKRLLGVAKNI